MSDCVKHVEIRPVTSQDFPRITEMYRDLDALHWESLPTVFQALDRPARSKSDLANIVEDESALFSVAVHAEQVVGLVHAMIRSSPQFPVIRPRRYVQVDTLLVDQRCRRLGIGRSLMAEVDRWAQAVGATQVELKVYEFNRSARDFYGDLGFETASRTLWKPVSSAD